MDGIAREALAMYFQKTYQMVFRVCFETCDFAHTFLGFCSHIVALDANHLNNGQIPLVKRRQMAKELAVANNTYHRFPRLAMMCIIACHRHRQFPKTNHGQQPILAILEHYLSYCRLWRNMLIDKRYQINDLAKARCKEDMLAVRDCVKSLPSIIHVANTRCCQIVYWPLTSVLLDTYDALLDDKPHVKTNLISQKLLYIVQQVKEQYQQQQTSKNDPDNNNMARFFCERLMNNQYMFIPTLQCLEKYVKNVIYLLHSVFAEQMQIVYRTTSEQDDRLKKLECVSHFLSSRLNKNYSRYPSIMDLVQIAMMNVDWLTTIFGRHPNIHAIALAEFAFKRHEQLLIPEAIMKRDLELHYAIGLLYHNTESAKLLEGYPRVLLFILLQIMKVANVLRYPRHMQRDFKVSEGITNHFVSALHFLQPHRREPVLWCNVLGAPDHLTRSVLQNIRTAQPFWECLRDLWNDFMSVELAINVLQQCWVDTTDRATINDHNHRHQKIVQTVLAGVVSRQLQVKMADILRDYPPPCMFPQYDDHVVMWARNIKPFYILSDRLIYT